MPALLTDDEIRRELLLLKSIPRIAQIAREAGYSRPYMHYIMRGEMKVSEEVRRRLSKVLNDKRALWSSSAIV